MNTRECDEIRDDLVGFADGELSGPAAERVREHIAGCAACAGLLDALTRSLAAARLIWADVAAGGPPAGEPLITQPALGAARAPHPRARRHPIRPWPALIAAAALLALAVSFWTLQITAQHPPTAQQAAVPAAPAPDLAAVQNEIVRAGTAAELLATTDYLARAPGGQEFACEGYRYIARTYHETAAGPESESRLAALCKD